MHIHRLAVAKPLKCDVQGFFFFKTCNSRYFGYLGCVDQLISQALGDGLDVPESSFSCSRAQQPDGLVDTREREREGSDTSV